MKKLIATIALLTMVCTMVIGCGGKKSSDQTTAAAQSGAATGETDPEGNPVTEEASTEEETNPENGLPLSKQPDPTAPVLDTVIVMAPVNGKISRVMDAVDELTEESLLTKLIELGTVADGTTFVSFDTSDTGKTQLAGPGGAAGETVAVKNGKLVLSGFKPGDGLDEATAKLAVADTYAENFDLDEVDVELQ